MSKILTIREVSKSIEWPTVALAGVIYGGWLVLTLSYSMVSPWIVLPLLAWLVAWQSSFQHEALHGHPSRHIGLNTALAWPPLSFWLPYRNFRDSHLCHHRNALLTLPDDDPESVFIPAARWAKIGRLRRAFYWVNMTLAGRLLLGPAIQAVALWRDEARAIAGGDRTRLATWLWHGVGITLIITWLTLVAEMPIWLYVVAVAYPAMALINIRSFGEHRAVAEPAKRSVIVEAGVFWRLLYLGNNYHALHHAEPGLAWYRIRRLYLARREAVLRDNGNFCYRGYREVFRRFGFRPLAAPPHPFCDR